MTPEQAVAWLILEGWRVVVDHHMVIRWFPPGDDFVTVPRARSKGKSVRIRMPWSRSELARFPDACPSEYPQYAAQVVDLILSGKVK